MSVHNLNRESMEEGDVYVGRAGHGFDGYFGNPFGTKGGQRCESVQESIHRFTEYAKDRLYHDPEYRERVKSLVGKRLFCFCKPGPCHGDVLEELARREAKVGQS